ncbi:unnamed protein product [Ceutorhynchus assimilis]|uniref:RAP domain-containing protein n=1 Tax=Ceutorhynchus assimilis TaxID=467358 RepID=A0A9P0GQC3_9CUCU|nr:unnamed protein product [Ceutorhynchus assimilis]
MNFSKNLLLKHYKLCCHLKSAILCKRHASTLSLRQPQFSINQLKHQKFTRKKSYMQNKKLCYFNKNSEMEEITGIYPYQEFQPLSKSEIVRALLFENSTDPVISEIEKCASIEEIFNFIQTNIDHLNYKHLTQIVITFSDLQDIFINHLIGDDQVEGRVEAKQQFFSKLLEYKEFYLVTEKIANLLDSYDPLFLSHTLIHLHWLGVSEESCLVQNIAFKLRNILKDGFSLDILVRLVKVIFDENSVRPYYMIIDLIPKVFDEIDKISSVKDLEDVTVFLYKLSHILTDDIINIYEAKVIQFINEGLLTENHYPVVLKIMSVFNLPKWRHQKNDILSKCIFLIQNSMELLNLTEMCHVYDILFKNQEPGDALNAIQRASAKLLHEIEDMDHHPNSKLKLFSCVIYFSSPINKDQFRQIVEKYLKYTMDANGFITLRKIFSSLKISDLRICESYWNKGCQILKKEKDLDKIVKLIESYMYFCSDLFGFRHHAFEHHALNLTQNYLEKDTLLPSKFFSLLGFSLLVCHDHKLLDQLLQKFKELGNQMNAVDLFKISHSLMVIRQRKSILTQEQIKQIKTILFEGTQRIYTYLDNNPVRMSLLIKASIIRNDAYNELIDEMIINWKHTTSMSSKLMENMCFALYATQSLVPEVVNICTEYVRKNKDKLMGFNAGKITYLLYQVNYQPVNEDEYFQTVIDIIIRDQERMSGLGFLQASLALCFFHRMPKSFIKQIFNVEFLDKLDLELASCYFRDRYPRRVRDTLMQLNRAVCLEYPEYNVPWFHQKFIEEFQKTNAIDDLCSQFHNSVKQYLIGIVNQEAIQENVITPYGYGIDFVLNLDQHKNPTNNFEDPYVTKVAILLIGDSAFTRFYNRLKGKQAMKNRHLEILGYKVKMVAKNEWNNLLYARERIDYVKQLVDS